MDAVPVDTYQFNEGRDEPDLNRMFEIDGDILSTVVSVDHNQSLGPNSRKTTFALISSRMIRGDGGPHTDDCEVIIFKLGRPTHLRQMTPYDLDRADIALDWFFN